MRFAWSVDGHRLEFHGRAALLVAGGLSIDGVRDEECRVKHSRPDYEFRLGNRRLVLKTLGDEAELWSGGLLIPPCAEHVPRQPAPDGAKCGTHEQQPAVLTCARCGTFACPQCEAVDGTHCVRCLAPFTKADELKRVIDNARPEQALALVGGPLGRAFWFFDSKVVQLAPPQLRPWVRTVVYGGLAVALLTWMALHAPDGRP